jgi:hypothetical protein
MDVLVTTVMLGIRASTGAAPTMLHGNEDPVHAGGGRRSPQNSPCEQAALHIAPARTLLGAPVAAKDVPPH